MLRNFNIPQTDTTSVNPVWQQDQSTLQWLGAMLAFQLPNNKL